MKSATDWTWTRVKETLWQRPSRRHGGRLLATMHVATGCRKLQGCECTPAPFTFVQRAKKAGCDAGTPKLVCQKVLCSTQAGFYTINVNARDTQPDPISTQL